MYKSRVFSFNEENLLRDIANYERDSGKEVTELQCNIKTYQVWVGLYRPELSYSVEIKKHLAMLKNNKHIHIYKFKNSKVKKENK